MLVLTRKVGEIVRINDDIQVQVVGIRGDRIRLGIQAPQNVKILREELCATDSAENDPPSNAS